MSKCLQTSIQVGGDLHTDILIQPFADRTLVLVTQTGKVGYLIQASIPSTVDLHTNTSSSASDLQQSLPPPPPAIQLTPIFGSAPSTDIQTLYSLYATHIATLLWVMIGGEPRNVVVGIALRMSRDHDEEGPNEKEQQTFLAIMDALRLMLTSKT